ncbi:MAG: HEAT repeat domain-containing protein, partial [Armatimonadetes bacterium]|nr:HEAT repeat domain-containing protein [Armatimonadota bacterium]
VFGQDLARTPASVKDASLAVEAWTVLKRALIEESLKEKLPDFSEGAGAPALQKLAPSTYVSLMSELAASTHARVRRRAVASLARARGPAVTAILVRALKDKDLSVRMEACAILGARGSRGVLPVYGKALKMKNRDARYLVLQSMKRVPYKWMVNGLRLFLKDQDPFMRVDACEALCRLGDEKGFMALRKAMRHGDKYLRSNVYAVVKESAGERVVPMLTRALKDKDPANRLFAAVYLARLNSARGLAVLKQSLLRGEPNIRFTVVDALAALKDKRALPVLRLALKDRDGNVAVSAAEALFARGSVAGAGTVRKALTSSDVKVRLRAVAAAKAGNTAAGVALLQEALGDRSRLVRLAAVEALSSLKEVKDRDRLRATMRDGDRSVRVAAAILLVHVGDREAVEVLTRFVQPDAAERDETARALEHVKAREVVPFLQVLATQGADSDRLRAVRALGQIAAGPAAEALGAIARTDADERLRLAAVESLADIHTDLSTYLLKGLLKEGTPEPLQRAAASILGDRGVASALPVLRKAAAENDVRAARALCKMGDASGVDVYRQILTAPDLAERIEAAVVLYRLERV